MHSFQTRQLAIGLRTSGWEYRQISRELGISTSTLVDWFRDPNLALKKALPSCWRCSGAVPLAVPDQYGYLLGQYLGDGHLVANARIPVLRIFACTDYPQMLEEISGAVTNVRGVRPGQATDPTSTRMVRVQSYWNHWPCVLPQHGPGMKHLRSIALVEWQCEFIENNPWPLIRGLIHSDGCRVINRFRHGDRVYSYPRYHFSNESTDIMDINTGALDLVGVRWTMCRPNQLAVSRRPDVALMDEHIGPKS